MDKLTREKLLEYYHQGFSDSYIGSLYKMTGEGIAYIRKKCGISLEEKPGIGKYKSVLYSTEKDLLSHDYYTMTQEMFSKKYNVSKTIWRPILKSRGIIPKTKYKRNSYPLLSDKQKTLIIGSLLGDGGISKDGYFYESHSLKQRQYLYKKHEILRPFSKKIYPVDNNTGLRFKTAHHNIFREFYRYFYRNNCSAKQIPLGFIQKNWHDPILAYWYLDDGYFDDESNELIIANAGPIDQLEKFLDFLNDKFGWGFRYQNGNVRKITFSKIFYLSFFSIVKEIAPSDMYYKFSEDFLVPEMVNNIPEYCMIYPKFYRKATNKEKFLNKFIYELRTQGFPEINLTSKRINYLKKLAYKNKKASYILWEIEHPEIYNDARCKWHSEDFIQEVAAGILSECPRITGQNIRHVIKKLLKISY